MSNFMNSSKELPVEAATGAVIRVWVVIMVAIQCSVRAKECCLTGYPDDRDDMGITRGRFYQKPETTGDIASVPVGTVAGPIESMVGRRSQQAETCIPKLVHPLFVATGKYRPFSI